MNDNLKTISIYGGSFDPPTMGHINVIQKALRFSDRLYVVIAVNKEKINSYSFSFEERKRLLLDYIDTYLPSHKHKIFVTILPSNEFLVAFGEKVGATILIRGLRDTIDFTAEQKIDLTNKKISPSIDTVYVMPDPEYAIVSSSWAKSLVGIYKWQDTLKGAVSEKTIEMMVYKWFKQETINILNEAIQAKWINPLISANKIWEELEKAYSPRHYHNLVHISNVLETSRYYYSDILGGSRRKKVLSEIAILFHDFEDSEIDSYNSCHTMLGLSPACLYDAYGKQSSILSQSKDSFGELASDYIKRLIMATDHSCPKVDFSDEEIMIATCDLFVLASTKDKYFDYTEKVKQEYREKDAYKFMSDYVFDLKWKEGRMKFVNQMLCRKSIFPTNNAMKDSVFTDTFEKQARSNLAMELERLIYKT